MYMLATQHKKNALQRCMRIPSKGLRTSYEVNLGLKALTIDILKRIKHLLISEQEVYIILDENE